MTQNEFNVVLEQQYRKCADVLVHKKKEYTGDRIDRLSAFKIAASLQGCTPKTALAGMIADARKPRDEILAKMAKILYVPIDVLTVPVLSEPREYDAASFWMHELSAEL